MIHRMLFGVALCAVAAASLAPRVVQAQGAAEDAGALVRDPDVERFYNEGVGLLEEKKYGEAITALNKAIAIDGAYPEAYLAKGDALKAMEDFQAAAQAYARALEFDSNSAAAFNGRGECFMELGDYNMALNDFTNALNLDRSNAAALSNMGHVLVTNQNPTDAMRVLDEALAIRPDDARALRDRGLAHALMREFNDAVVDLKKAVEVDALDYENYATLATVYQFQDDFASASDALSKAIETYKPKKRTDPPSFTVGYIYRADALLRVAEKETDQVKRTAALEGVIADANAVLATYEDRFPESGRALFRRGRAERLLERYSDAVNSFTKAIQLVPAGQDIEYISDAYLYRGICWYYIGSLDLARGDFEQASSLGSGFQDPRIYLWIGFTHHRQGDFRQAVDAYSQAVAKSPLFALAHVNKGRAYMDLREYNKAIESFNKAIRSEPDVGDYYYYVGVAYIKLDDFEKAKDFLDLALLQKDPTPKMYRAMAIALRGLGKDELAEQYDRQAETPGAAVGATSTEAASPAGVQ
jgi:tetratricopeptide (TPR) repeat protein